MNKLQLLAYRIATAALQFTPETLAMMLVCIYINPVISVMWAIGVTLYYNYTQRVS